MTREEEYRFGKRMEFFKRRLAKVVELLELPAEVAGYLLQSAQEGCCGKESCAVHGPACAKLKRCPSGKVSGSA